MARATLQDGFVMESKITPILSLSFVKSVPCELSFFHYEYRRKRILIRLIIEFMIVLNADVIGTHKLEALGETFNRLRKGMRLCWHQVGLRVWNLVVARVLPLRQQIVVDRIHTF